ncbi:MAG: outer membrane beta-barrel protein [Psychrilyobacter sp.]|uniref:outer membrane beta-barrel protein n=1 Tax=Psychrilyobacter sp. TaxID=2586924 RepID=UPI003C742ED6
MKKLYILIFFVYYIVSLAEDTDKIEFRLGGNIAGKYKEVNTTNFKNNSEPKGIGYEFIVELIHEPILNLITGLGTGYQRESEIRVKGKNCGVIDTIPIYATVKYRFNDDGIYKPYIKLNLGVSIPYTKSELEKTGVTAETGFYYSLGGGMEYKNMIVDLSYQYNRNKLDGDYDGKIETSKLTLGIGYRLDI